MGRLGSAEEVADQAVGALGRDTVLVNGFMNSLATTTLRFVPRSLVARAARALEMAKLEGKWVKEARE